MVQRRIRVACWLFPPAGQKLTVCRARSCPRPFSVPQLSGVISARTFKALFTLVSPVPQFLHHGLKDTHIWTQPYLYPSEVSTVKKMTNVPLKTPLKLMSNKSESIKNSISRSKRLKSFFVVKVNEGKIGNASMIVKQFCEGKQVSRFYSKRIEMFHILPYFECEN